MKLSHAPRVLRSTLLATLATSMVLTGPACDQQTDPGTNLVQTSPSSGRMDWAATAALGASSSCNHALDQLKDNVRTEMLLQAEQVRRQFIDPDNNGGFGRAMVGDMGLDSAAEGSATPMAGGDGAGMSQDPAAPPQDVSETNVQVVGVDEADFVKTDAEFLYTLSGDDMVSVAAWPADDMVEVGRVQVKGNPHSLYQYGDDIVVLSYAWRDLFIDAGEGEGKYAYEDDYYYNWHNWQPLTLVTVIDTSNPASPVIKRADAFEGNLTSTRRIGADVYLIQNTWTYVQGLQYWPNVNWNASISDKLSALHRMVTSNLDLIDELTLDDFLPYRYSVSADGQIDSDQAEFAADCQHVYLPSAHSGTNLTTVVTLNLDSGTIHGSAVPGNWGAVYASADALYVAATNWNYNWFWQNEDDTPTVTSHIHKFDISPKSGRASYVASGSVTGYVLNQFSMDEHGGILRVATTEPDWWGWWDGNDDSESHVTMLGQKGMTLEQIGHVGGLGKGEQIYSVRFVGDRGYVVTFRQIDPLYVLDLRNPMMPKVTGELKIPGFSSYMHPMDETHLLTIGRDGGLSFQIFDVADPTDPLLVQKTVLGDSWNVWSEALYDHHAFNYFAARGLLGLPVSGYEYDESSEDDWGWYGRYVSKLQLFKIDIDTGITPVGAISHDTLFEQYEGDDDCMYYNSYGWEAQIRRSVFMDDFVYTLSNLGVRAHDTRDLDAGSIADVLTLDEDANPYSYYGCY